MNEFLKSNFKEYKIAFEKYMDCKLCSFIEDNMIVMDNPKDKNVIELPKWFLCLSLLRNPDQKIINKCNELFSGVNNLWGRTAHQYACDQVFGFLNEVYHIKRLTLKHSDKTFLLNGSEFNRITNKRELYTSGGSSRDFDLKVSFNGRIKNIHLKANNTFAEKPKITFRGGKNPEINLIRQGQSDTHILIDKDRFLSISSLIKDKECIEDEFPFDKWGGPGGYRILFKDNVFDYASYY